MQKLNSAQLFIIEQDLELVKKNIAALERIAEKAKQEGNRKKFRYTTRALAMSRAHKESYEEMLHTGYDKDAPENITLAQKLVEKVVLFVRKR